MSEGKKRSYGTGESDSQSSAGRPPRKTQRLEKYPATPKQHAAMDEAVMGEPIIRLNLYHPLAHFAPLLIAQIIGKADPEVLDQKFIRLDEATNLLATDGLFEVLQNAWDTKSFAPIRNLGQPWYQYLELKGSN
jgi:hypothetical protein